MRTASIRDRGRTASVHGREASFLALLPGFNLLRFPPTLSSMELWRSGSACDSSLY